MNKTQKTLCAQIVEYYGSKQLNQYMEEAAELTIALNKYLRAINKHDTYAVKLLSNVQGEIADVLIMLEQLKYYFGITDTDIEHQIDYKLKRTLKIINLKQEANNDK